MRLASRSSNPAPGGFVLCVALLAAVVAASASQARPPASATPEEKRTSIFGAWVLNDLEADVPSDAPPGGPGQRGPGGGGGMGGPPPGGGQPSGGGGGMGGPGGRPPEADVRRLRDLVRQAREGSRRLTIVQEGEVVVITDADGRVEKFTANGKKEKRLTNAGMIESKATWEGMVLIVESEPADGLKLTRRFSIIQAEGGPPQLEVHVMLKGSRLREPIEARRYYDAQEN